jgi:hypothetical protein
MMERLILCILLGGVVTSAQYDDHATSRSLNRALGVECTHCHGDPRSADAERPAFAVARRMIAMVEEINAAALAPINGRISCWTCHDGQIVPARLPRSAWEKVLATWPAGSTPTVGLHGKRRSDLRGVPRSRRYWSRHRGG